MCKSLRENVKKLGQSYYHCENLLKYNLLRTVNNASFQIFFKKFYVNNIHKLEYS